MQSCPFRPHHFDLDVCVLWSGPTKSGCSGTEKCVEMVYVEPSVAAAKYLICPSEGGSVWDLQGNCACGRNQCNIRFPLQPPQQAGHMRQHTETSARAGRAQASSKSFQAEHLAFTPSRLEGLCRLMLTVSAPDSLQHGRSNTDIARSSASAAELSTALV